MLNYFKYTDKEKKELLKSIGILVDTREQENSHIINWFDSKGIVYKTKAMDQGDYSFFIPKNELLSIPRTLYFNHEIMIERKNSLEELSGNFTEGRDRFEKEMVLAPKCKSLLIENSNYIDICKGNYNTEYKKESYLPTLHTFMHRYNLPTMFMPDKEFSAIYIYYTCYYYLKEILN